MNFLDVARFLVRTMSVKFLFWQCLHEGIFWMGDTKTIQKAPAVQEIEFNVSQTGSSLMLSV